MTATVAQVASDLAKLTARVAALESKVAALTPAPAPVPASPIDLGMAAVFPVLPDVLVSDVPTVDFGVDPAAWTMPLAQTLPLIDNDVVGAFRLTSQVTHVSNADSLAFPGVPRPHNHHHTYWGNPLSDENSTYTSLAKAGVGSGEGGPLNRSSKWMQSLLTYDGHVCIPEYITEYYKQQPSLAAQKLLQWPTAAQTVQMQAFINQHRVHLVDANGNDTGRFADTVPIPNGLRYIVGNNLPADFLGGVKVQWHLYDTAMNPLKDSARFADLQALMTQGQTYFVSAEFNSPPGWDGKHASVGDHHSHMQYIKWSPNGYSYLPETHPFVVPAIMTKPMWRITPAMGDPKKLFFSSDLSEPGDRAHMEYQECWHPATKQAWHTNIIDGFKSVSSGILGDGRMLNRPPCFTFSVVNNVISVDSNGKAQLVDANGNRL